MFQPTFEKENIRERVVNQFIGAVTNDKLLPGTKLESEVQLAASFQISRNILREAMKTLEVLGIIEVIHGRGTYIAENAKYRIANLDFIKALASDQTISELFETRVVIEPGLAQFAAERRTKEDIEKLWKATDIMVDTSYPVVSLFHQTIAEVSGCKVLSEYLKAILMRLQLSDYGKFVSTLSKSQKQTESLEHRKIIESIINQDGKTARNLMYNHINERYKFIQSMQK